jgi:hypothetical protein
MARTTLRVLTGTAVLVALALAGGCEDILGLKRAELYDAGIGAGGGGGGGGGGSMACTPGSTVPCYGGPANTKNVGPCKGGTATCKPDGSGFGECVGDVTPNPEDCTTVGDENCDGNACSDAVWADICPSTTMGNAILLTGIAADASGNVFLVGNYSGTINFGNNIALTASFEGFLTKFDPAGKVLWAKGIASDQLNAVGIDGAGDIYVAGNFSGAKTIAGASLVSAGAADILVASFDTTGAPRWARAFGGTGDDSATAMHVSASGKVVITGTFTTSFKFSVPLNALPYTGAHDVFVAKLGSSGVPVWSRSFGDAPGMPASDQLPSGITSDGAENVIVTGNFGTSMALGGTAFTSAGSRDIFIESLDGNGGHRWGAAYGSPGFDGAMSVAVDASGAPIITGSIGGPIDFGGGKLAGATNAFLAKFDASGKYQWSASFGDAKGSAGRSVAVDPADGSVLLGGSSAGAITFGNRTLMPAGGDDAFVASFDSGGGSRWAKMFGDAGEQLNSVVAVQPGTRNVVLAFYNTGTVDLGTGMLSSMGGVDTIVLGSFQR